MSLVWKMSHCNTLLCSKKWYVVENSVSSRSIYPKVMIRMCECTNYRCDSTRSLSNEESDTHSWLQLNKWHLYIRNPFCSILLSSWIIISCMSSISIFFSPVIVKFSHYMFIRATLYNVPLCWCESKHWWILVNQEIDFMDSRIIP